MKTLSLKSISGFALSVMIVTQVLFVANVLIIPKPAEAVFPVIITANPWQIVRDIGTGLAKQAALRVVDGFLTRFMNKVVEKYKIRNYVYYDQVLTDYYVTNYIRDKISDPDLKNIFLLLDSAYIAGNSTGYTGYNPNNAIIPQLKKKINDLYLARGGVDPNLLNNPPADWTPADKFDAAKLSYIDNPLFSYQAVNNQYLSYRAANSTAAQLEIIAGDGYKSGRLLGGSCTLSSGNGPKIVDPASDPTTCASAGGTWNPSVMDYARAFIDNPGGFAHDFVSGAIDQVFSSNYDPNNIWSAVGSILGNFLYNRLALNNNSGVLNDGGQVFQTSNGTAVPTTMDIDGDGIIDAYDFDNDGVADQCAIQGIAPNCMGSIEATIVPDDESAPFDALTKHPDQSNIVSQVKNDLASRGIDLSGPCGAFEITKRVAWILRSSGAGLLDKPSGNNCQGYSVDVIVYSDGYAYDIISDSGASNGPTWQPLPLLTDLSRYKPPFDPGN
jgi:hypothetical protein